METLGPTLAALSVQRALIIVVPGGLGLCVSGGRRTGPKRTGLRRIGLSSDRIFIRI